MLCVVMLSNPLWVFMCASVVQYVHVGHVGSYVRVVLVFIPIFKESMPLLSVSLSYLYLCCFGMCASVA